MIKKILAINMLLVMGLHSVVKTTKILDFDYQFSSQAPQLIKKFINKTGKKLWLRYRVVNPKTGDFVGQEPIFVPEAIITVDFTNLGNQVLPAGYGRIKVFVEIGKVIQTPEKKLDELSVYRFKNGKKDLMISSYQFDENDEFELYVDSDGRLICKSQRSFE